MDELLKLLRENGLQSAESLAERRDTDAEDIKARIATYEKQLEGKPEPRTAEPSKEERTLLAPPLFADTDRRDDDEEF